MSLAGFAMIFMAFVLLLLASGSRGDGGDGDAINGEGYEKFCGGSSDGLGDLERLGDGGGLGGGLEERGRAEGERYEGEDEESEEVRHHDRHSLLTSARRHQAHARGDIQPGARAEVVFT